MLLFQGCGLFARRNLLILGFKSVYGIVNSSGLRSNADLLPCLLLNFLSLECGLGSSFSIS